MTYYLAALTNDKAQLIVHQMQTTDKAVAAMALVHWENQGYLVKAWEEM